jgi:predicted NUDIX family NTP pyrophosphohydrolase
MDPPREGNKEGNQPGKEGNKEGNAPGERVIKRVMAAGKKSAGLLLFRRSSGSLEVFLVHPGGPFWSRKDEGAWSVPKGEIEEGEDPLAAARREVEEETGFAVHGQALALHPLRQSGGKTVYAWAVEQDVDPALLVSNAFSMEWPPKSGRMQEFPEVDRGGWFPLEAARGKILKGQADFLSQLQELVGKESG